MKYRIDDLLLVDKDKNIGKKVNIIKEFLEGNDVSNLFKKNLSTDDLLLKVQFHGSYNRHTASFVLKEEKSDIDIIIYIGEYMTDNSIQKWKNKEENYKKNMASKINKNLDFTEKYIPNDHYVDLKVFLKIKKDLFSLLKEKFSNDYNVLNKNKCICLSNNKMDIDIVLAGKWILKMINEKEIEGANIIVEDGGNEIQNLPNLNRENIESKKEKAEYLYEYIRIFKNLNKIYGFSMSSFNVENLLFNVPNAYFLYRPDKELILKIISYLRFTYIRDNDYPEIYENNKVFIINNKIKSSELLYWLNTIEEKIKMEIY